MPAGKQKKLRVSIVIRTFNEEKHISGLLNAIEQQKTRNLEVILVDSGSTDKTLNIVRKHQVRVVHLKPSDFTFGRSLNKGVETAKGDVVVLASAHISPLTDHWLNKLVAPFDDPLVALTYGKQRGTQDSKFSEAQHFRKWFPERSDFDQRRAFCNNANSAIRKSVWKQNHFNEELTGLEDVAWASWARQVGYKIAYVADAGVAHAHNESPSQIVNRHRREALALRQILPKSRFTLLNFVSLYIRNVISDCGAALRQGVFFKEILGILSFRYLQYSGTYRGYRDPLKPSQQLRQAFYYPPNSLEFSKSAKKRAPERSHKSA
jgi:glycosyltransferase involved in cell wall biosynthesis